MSELVIRGLHDDKTVQQMWTCMGVGDVRAGVLCADGHYGYAQPVGGASTVEILHTLKPVLVHMAGNEIRDPYKD